MPRTRKVGPAGRFGARAGATVRSRRAAIEVVMKQKHECPRCSTRSVKRQIVGVWRCRKCGFTFAGGAYVPSTKVGTYSRRS